MIDRIRHTFLARTGREKFMVLIMLLVGAVIWVTFFADRLDAFLSERAELSRQIEYQQTYLDNQDLIRERVDRGIANLDTARTLDATNLFVEVQNLAQRQGFRPSIDSPSTEPGDVFSHHTLRLTIQGAEIADLINFTADLQERAPYIAIDEIIITADRTDRRRLDARYRIYAVELTP